MIIKQTLHVLRLLVGFASLILVVNHSLLSSGDEYANCYTKAIRKSFEVVVEADTLKWKDINSQKTRCKGNLVGKPATKLTALNCKNDTNTLDNQCVIFPSETKSNLYCHVGMASRISKLFKVHGFDGTRKLYELNIKNIYYILAEKNRLSCMSLNCKEHENIDNNEAALSNDGNQIIAWFKNKKLYIANSMREIGTIFDVEMDKQYTLCNRDFVSKFLIKHDGLVPIECTFGTAFCMNLNHNEKNNFTVGNVQIFFNKEKLVVASPNSDISFGDSSCEFIAPDEDIYCYDGNKSPDPFYQCVEDKACDSQKCREMYSSENGVTVGGISFHKDSSGNFIMKPKIKDGSFKPKVSIHKIDKENILGLVDSDGNINAIIKGDEILAAKYANKPKETLTPFKETLLCSNDNADIKICDVDDTITLETEFHLMKNQSVMGIYAYLADSNSTMFNSQTVLYSRYAKYKNRNLWLGDQLLATFIEEDFYTATNASALDFCKSGDQSAATTPVHITGTDYFRQECGDEANKHIIDVNGMQFLNENWIKANAGSELFLPYCLAKQNALNMTDVVVVHNDSVVTIAVLNQSRKALAAAWGDSISYSNLLTDKIPTYYAGHTDKEKCKTLQAGQSRAVALDAVNSLVGMCYNVNGSILHMESAPSMEFLERCDNDILLVHDSKCKTRNPNATNCEIYLPSSFAVYNDTGYGPSSVLCTTEYARNRFWPIEGLQIEELKKMRGVAKIVHTESNAVIGLCRNGLFYAHGINEFTASPTLHPRVRSFANMSVEKIMDECSIASDIIATAIVKYVPESKSLFLISEGISVGISNAGVFASCGSGIHPQPKGKILPAKLFGPDSKGPANVMGITINLNACDNEMDDDIKCIIDGEFNIYMRENDIYAVKIVQSKNVLALIVIGAVVFVLFIVTVLIITYRMRCQKMRLRKQSNDGGFGNQMLIESSDYQPPQVIPDENMNTAPTMPPTTHPSNQE